MQLQFSGQRGLIWKTRFPIRICAYLVLDRLVFFQLSEKRAQQRKYVYLIHASGRCNIYFMMMKGTMHISMSADILLWVFVKVQWISHSWEVSVGSIPRWGRPWGNPVHLKRPATSVKFMEWNITCIFQQWYKSRKYHRNNYPLFLIDIGI